MIEREYDISGAIVFWSLQPTPYQALLEVLQAKGYGACMPNVQDGSVRPGELPSRPATARRTRPSSAASSPSRTAWSWWRSSGTRSGTTTPRTSAPRWWAGAVKADYGLRRRVQAHRGVPEAQGRLTTSAVGASADRGAARHGRDAGPDKRGRFTTCPSTGLSSGSSWRSWSRAARRATRSPPSGPRWTRARPGRSAMP